MKMVLVNEFHVLCAMWKSTLGGCWHEGCSHLACVYQWSEICLSRLSFAFFMCEPQKGAGWESNQRKKRKKDVLR
jgi:hypothetical protein